MLILSWLLNKILVYYTQSEEVVSENATAGMEAKL